MNACGRFAHDGFNRGQVAQAAGDRHRVLNVRFEGVFGLPDGGDPALGIVGVRFLQVSLGDEKDFAVFGGFERGAKTRNPPADDECIRQDVREATGFEWDKVSAKHEAPVFPRTILRDRLLWTRARRFGY